jgi:hypothetical protein
MSTISNAATATDINTDTTSITSLQRQESKGCDVLACLPTLVYDSSCVVWVSRALSGPEDLKVLDAVSELKVSQVRRNEPLLSPPSLSLAIMCCYAIVVWHSRSSLCR